MIKNNSIGKWENISRGEKIVLAVLPFGVPLIPPLGISCLKVFLQQHGFSNVKTIDVVVEPGFKDEYSEYFDILKQAFVGNENEEVNSGNYYYNIGHMVLTHHMMAHLKYNDEKKYIQLIKLLIHKNFYVMVDDEMVLKLKKIIDKFYSRMERYLVRILKEEKPGVLGLSISRDTLPVSMFAFKVTRKMYPQIRTVMGGTVFFDELAPGTHSLEIFLDETKEYIDKIIIGEGELLFLKLLQGEFPEEQRVYTGQDINGELLDLSTAGIPDFYDFNLSYYPYIGSYTSRSCPFKCSFCAETVGWGKYRKKSAPQVAVELMELYKRHGNQLFFMGDSLLNPIITSLARELIKTDRSFYWDGYLRVGRHVCSRENTMLWRRGGFYRARLGLESGSQRVLGLIDKKITIKQTKEAISALAYAGIKTTTFWIVGHPGETEEDFQMTLNLLGELKDDLYEAFCIPFTYHLSGQVKSDDWRKENTPRLVYPEEFINMLIVQDWTMDCEPSREEAFKRCLRFIMECKRLNIPYPQLFSEVIQAEERWKLLHENAVPPQTEFINRKNYIDENKYIKDLIYIQSAIQDDSDFNF